MLRSLGLLVLLILGAGEAAAASSLGTLGSLGIVRQSAVAFVRPCAGPETIRLALNRNGRATAIVVAGPPECAGAAARLAAPGLALGPVAHSGGIWRFPLPRPLAPAALPADGLTVTVLPR